jgi:pimeloyl-ACP methyl ester carboxylesterase
MRSLGCRPSGRIRAHADGHSRPGTAGLDVGSTVRSVLKALAALVVAVVGGLTLLGALQRPDTRLPAGAIGNHVQIGATAIRYAQAGQGRDVLLLHGSPGSVEDWSPVFDRLAERFRVTAFDRPGHGYSGGAELPHTLEENARLTLEVIHALRLRDVVVVGHSYGGATSLALATRNPKEARAFVIVGSRAHGPVPVEELYRLLCLPMFGTGLAAVAAPWVGPARIESGIRSSFGPNLAAMPAEFLSQRAALWGRPTVTHTLACERVTLEASLGAMALHYAEIRKPVFLVYGEQDARNYRDAGSLTGEIPGATLVSLPNTGHYVQYARPDALIHVIEQAAAAP